MLQRDESDSSNRMTKSTNIRLWDDHFWWTINFRSHGLSLLIVTKLIWLEVTNRIVVVELNLISEFDHRFWSSSKSNDGFESTITISILMRSFLIIVDWIRTFFQLKSITFDLFRYIVDWKIKKDCPNVNYLIKNDELCWKQPIISNMTTKMTKSSRFWPFSIKFDQFLIYFWNLCPNSIRFVTTITSGCKIWIENID